jgi:hypothetical protein
MQDLKERCREVIVTHLNSRGFPKLSRQQVLNELLTMWKKMDAVGLVTELRAQGWTYGKYVESAKKAAKDAAIYEALQQLAQRIRRGK